MILALDLEGTLVSNAVSQIPRPGLRPFLDAVSDLYADIVLYSSVREERVRAVVAELVSRGEAPEWLAEVECVRWAGPYKRLHILGPPGGVLLVDDMMAYVHPDDREHWVAIPSYDPPYPPDDRALERVLAELTRRAEGEDHQSRSGWATGRSGSGRRTAS